MNYNVGDRFILIRDNPNHGPDYGKEGDVVEFIRNARTHCEYGTQILAYIIESDGSKKRDARIPVSILSPYKEQGPSQEDQWDEILRGKKMSDTTGNVIFKYQMPVLESFEMKLPIGARIIRIEDQGGMFWMWALVNTEVQDETRKFYSFKCGGKIPEHLDMDKLVYVGFCKIFVQQELGLYIFEDISNDA